MRLLNTRTLQLEEFLPSAGVPRYAILSHRWEDDEVTYQHLLSHSAETHQGWLKIKNCCQTAQKANIDYVWVDTCCIDKSSSAELTEAINSMFKYYKESQICYAYLNDVYVRRTSPYFDEEMSSSVWFKRGWTLQELIAPKDLSFFDCHWRYLCSKRSYSQQLQRITRIDARLLEGTIAIDHFSLAQRMAWASLRKTTRVEDEAYCLLGIFEVNMPLLYGEGKGAFRRLQAVIIDHIDDQSLFAWHGSTESIKSVLAPSAACFEGLHDLKCVYTTNDGRYGHELSNSGLKIKLMLIPWTMGVYVAPLSVGSALPESKLNDKAPVRRYRRLGIFLRQTKYTDHFVRTCVEIDGKFRDTVMLNSDTVAEKRDQFKISDRQIIIRQTLIDLPDEMQHLFAFTFNHAHLFSAGYLPEYGREIKNRFFQVPGTRSGYTTENYSHYASATFQVANRASRKYFLYLGFDLNFMPFCVITSKDMKPDKDATIFNDFDGMYRPEGNLVPLSRLLPIIESAHGPNVVMLVRGLPGNPYSAECRELSLKVEFQIVDMQQLDDASGRDGQMWHVNFAETSRNPPAPIIWRNLSVLLPWRKQPSGGRGYRSRRSEWPLKRIVKPEVTPNPSRTLPFTSIRPVSELARITCVPSEPKLKVNRYTDPSPAITNFCSPENSAPQPPTIDNEKHAENSRSRESYERPVIAGSVRLLPALARRHSSARDQKIPLTSVESGQSSGGGKIDDLQISRAPPPSTIHELSAGHDELPPIYELPTIHERPLAEKNVNIPQKSLTHTEQHEVYDHSSTSQCLPEIDQSPIFDQFPKFEQFLALQQFSEV